LKPAVDDDIQAMAGNSAVRCLCFGFRPHSGTSPFSRMANASGSLPIDLANSRTWPLERFSRSHDAFAGRDELRYILGSSPMNRSDVIDPETKNRGDTPS
jgi:hypothetical protein